MKEYIHTIPVLEALRDPKNCAFCVMHKRIEEHAIQFIMGPAYMEDDIRMETNKIGFCHTHMESMYKEQNRLGLALMLHTHIQQLNKDITAIINAKASSPLFGKDTTSPLAKMQSYLDKSINSCYVCKKVEHNFALYIDTFLHLWNKGGEEAKLIKDQKSYCLPHFTRLVATATEKLSRGKRERFIEEIAKPQLADMKQLEEDVEWFTLKFDHRNADQPWKNAKDAIPRALAMFGSTKEF
ncbi:MAG: DUF6062 family protein [Defluviitaleaceae bacterium]|nr:DUF6062 family protein [Defluviitaleaceae bacterium]